MLKRWREKFQGRRDGAVADLARTRGGVRVSGTGHLCRLLDVSALYNPNALGRVPIAPEEPSTISPRFPSEASAASPLATEPTLKVPGMPSQVSSIYCMYRFAISRGCIGDQRGVCERVDDVARTGAVLVPVQDVGVPRSAIVSSDAMAILPRGPERVAGYSHIDQHGSHIPYRIPGTVSSPRDRLAL